MKRSADVCPLNATGNYTGYRVSRGRGTGKTERERVLWYVPEHNAARANVTEYRDRGKIWSSEKGFMVDA